MSQYATIKNIIDQVVTTNGQQEITGALLNEVLKAMVDSLGSDFQYGGVVVPSSYVGTPDQNVFYFALQAGTYTSFGNTKVPNGITIFMWDGSWTSKILFAGDGGIFDITEYNNNSKYADLAAALGTNGTNVPVSLRKGGVSVKFVNSSNNNYEQWFLKTNHWSLNVSDWMLSENITPSIFRDSQLWSDIAAEASLNGYVDKNGTFYTDSNWLSSDFIEMSPLQVFIFNAVGHTIVSTIAIYDSNHVLISNIVASQNETLFSNVFQAPSNAAYYRICKHTGDNGQVFYISNPNVFNNIRSITPVTDSGYILVDGTELDGDSHWIKTDYIEISENERIFVNLKDDNNQVRVISFFDSSHNLISYESGNHLDIYVSIPTGTKYIRFCGKSGSFGNYLPIIRLFLPIADECLILQEQFKKLNDEMSPSIFRDSQLWSDITAEASLNGYVDKNGTFYTDSNWLSSDFIEMSPLQVFIFNAVGHTLVSTIAIYDSNHVLISNIVASQNETLFSNVFQAPSNAAYYRICKSSRYNKQVFYISNPNLFNNKNSWYKNDVIYPYAIYDVCNDIPNDVTNGGRNRNASQAIYIDHFLTGITHEMNIRFKDAVDRFVFTAPMYVTDASEATPNTNFNNGNNINDDNIQFSIVGTDIAEQIITVKHRSTLNSITSASHPKVLCIGDSITYGEQATMPNDDYASNQVYHLICKQLFMKDAIDNSGNGFNVSFLGHYVKENTFAYKGTTYQCKTHHEGIRGISMASYLDGTVTAFKSSVTNKFSIDAWLGKYRTMDDAGNRLPWVSAGATVVGQDGNTYTIGTLIGTESDLYNIDVCLPSHILVMLGMNGGATVAQYQEMINIIHAEHPDIYIAIGIPDSAGTYFPSLHPNCGLDCVIWNDNKHGQGSRHTQMFTIQKNLQEEFAKTSYEEDRVFMLPFFFVTPTAEGVSNRVANLPDAEYNIVKNNDFLVNYGWHASTHMNAYGHMNWGYCLYSWLKYTIALGLTT